MKYIFFSFISIFLVSCSNNLERNENFQLTIIHMNDIHSHLESETRNFVLNSDNNLSSEQITMQLGGMPRAIEKIHTLQNKYKNNLTLNAGDLIQGTLYFTIFDGNASVAMYNEITWDGFEVGNHEWDEGDLILKNILNSLDSGTILASNIIPDGITIKEDRFKPYFIKEMENQKVGVIGIDIVNKTILSSNPSEHITFLPELETAQNYIDILLSKGINKIILLSHVGYTNDLIYAEKLHGVDVIVGGDSHTLMGDYSSLGLESEIDKYPTQVYNADDKKVCIVQAWSNSYVVGELHITFDKNGDIMNCDGVSTLNIGDEFLIDGKKVDEKTNENIVNFIEQHNEIEIVSQNIHALEVLQNYKNIIEEKQKEVIAHSKTYLSNNRIPYQNYDNHGELAHGSELVPLVCKGFLEADLNAQLCIQNAGAIRTSIDEGDITIQTVYNLLPFKNTLYEITLSGSEIKSVLEDGISNYIDNGGSSGSFPYAYALRYDINISKPFNSRVTNLEYMDKQTSQWLRLKNDANYVVITNSYLASGHDGYTTLKNISQNKKIDTYIDYAMSFVNYLKKETKNGNDIEKLSVDLLPIKCFIDTNHNECPIY